MAIRSLGEDTTLTRKQLLQIREADERRLREKWAKEKDDKDS
jgi:hypothetical protein